MGRLATQGWPWGYDQDGGTLITGRGESFAKTESGRLLGDTAAPASGDIRCFRGYFKLTGAVAGDYRDFAYTTDWNISLDADGKLALTYTPAGGGSSTSGVHTDIPRVDCPMDGAWHLFEVGQRFGPDGYFGVRIDGVLVHDNPEFDYDPAAGGAARSYSFYAPDTDLAWTDLALNDDTWVGPGKTVLAKPTSGSATGIWADGTSWAEGDSTSTTSSDISGSLNPTCERGLISREHYDSPTGGFNATNLANVPPTPSADYGGDGSLAGGDYHAGEGAMVTNSASYADVHDTWQPAAHPTSVPGDTCYLGEWDRVREHNYGGRRDAASGDAYTVDIDYSNVTGTVAWTDAQAFISQGVKPLGAGFAHSDEYVTLTRPGDSTPGSGSPAYMLLNAHSDGSSNPTNYGVLHITDPAGGTPASLTVTRHVGGDQILNSCAAGVAVDCEHVAQPPLPEHDDTMWIA